MTATLFKSLKSGTKEIHGQVMRRGMGTITLILTDKNGAQSLKTYKESDYTVVCRA
jgi:hypothetical protein